MCENLPKSMPRMGYVWSLALTVDVFADVFSSVQGIHSLSTLSPLYPRGGHKINLPWSLKSVFRCDKTRLLAMGVLFPLRNQSSFLFSLLRSLSFWQKRWIKKVECNIFDGIKYISES